MRRQGLVTQPLAKTAVRVPIDTAAYNPVTFVPKYGSFPFYY
jgi:hypothetical protein